MSIQAEATREMGGYWDDFVFAYASVDRLIGALFDPDNWEHKHSEARVLLWVYRRDVTPCPASPTATELVEDVEGCERQHFQSVRLPDGRVWDSAFHNWRHGVLSVTDVLENMARRYGSIRLVLSSKGDLRLDVVDDEVFYYQAEDVLRGVGGLESHIRKVNRFWASGPKKPWPSKKEES